MKIMNLRLFNWERYNNIFYQKTRQFRYNIYDPLTKHEINVAHIPKILAVSLEKRGVKITPIMVTSLEKKLELTHNGKYGLFGIDGLDFNTYIANPSLLLFTIKRDTDSDLKLVEKQIKLECLKHGIMDFLECTWHEEIENITDNYAEILYARYNSDNYKVKSDLHQHTF